MLNLLSQITYLLNNNWDLISGLPNSKAHIFNHCLGVQDRGKRILQRSFISSYIHPSLHPSFHIFQKGFKVAFGKIIFELSLERCVFVNQVDRARNGFLCRDNMRSSMKGSINKQLFMAPDQDENTGRQERQIWLNSLNAILQN